MQAAQDAVVKVDQIPVQYRKKNVAEYRSQLKESLVPIDDKIQEIQGRLKEDEKFLGEKTAEELSLELDQAKNEFIRVQTDYRHWLHIREVYQKAKLSLEEDSEIKDVERRFAKNLQLITGGKVVLQSLNGTMDVSITSGTNRLAEEILSEGTRDTIALAFRLAMMEHLFPDGGGLLVLDDPFTEMDPVRTKKACELLQAFADNGNQVIFVTCDKKYSNLMSGNVIQV